MELVNLREFFHRRCTGEGEEDEDGMSVQATINLSVHSVWYLAAARKHFQANAMFIFSSIHRSAFFE